MGKFAINEELLQQVETLQLIVKDNIAGMFGGNHQSKTFGSSCEFADYRDYIPGDDISKIDWNAYARFDKLFLKLYLDERQLHTRIYIDASRSMDYGKGQKAIRALQIAAAMAYLSICEMDKVSIYYIKDNKVYDLITNMVGKETYYTQINKLNNIDFDGEIKISEAILPSTVGYGDGMSIIISDFLTDYDFAEAIDYLASKKRNVFCIQLLESEELKPKTRGKIHLFDSENINVSYRKNVNKDIINAYKEALNYIIERVRTQCLTRNGYYLLANVDLSVKEIFLRKMMQEGVLK